MRFAPMVRAIRIAMLETVVPRLIGALSGSVKCKTVSLDVRVGTMYFGPLYNSPNRQLEAELSNKGTELSVNPLKCP